MESPLSLEELEVSGVLLNLSELFIIMPEPKPRRRYFGILPRWGLQKPRSIPSDKPPDPSPAPESKEPIPEPTPPAPPPASSPSTPMSFPATSEETEPKLVSPKKPSLSLSSKIHHQCIKEQNEKIAVLSATRDNLQRSLESSKGNYVKIEAQDSRLNEISLQRERKRRKVTLTAEEAINSTNGSELAGVERHHPRDGGDDANNDHRKRKFVWLPDLNMSVEEVDRLERAAAAAQARKRRREICRQKASASAASAAGRELPPRPSMKRKVARLTC